MQGGYFCHLERPAFCLEHHQTFSCPFYARNEIQKKSNFFLPKSSKKKNHIAILFVVMQYSSPDCMQRAVKAFRITVDSFLWGSVQLIARKHIHFFTPRIALLYPQKLTSQSISRCMIGLFVRPQTQKERNVVWFSAAICGEDHCLTTQRTADCNHSP